MSSPSTPPKKENLVVNLVCNIAIPTIILTKFSKDQWLGPVWGLLVAVAFPLGYGVYDLVTRKKTNLLSILGVVSVVLTGGLGLLKANGFWFAVKEGAVPLVIGAFVLISLRTRKPLIKELIFNEQVIDVERVNAALAERNEQPAFNRLLRNASMWLAGSFLGSAILNFALARYFLKSPPATPQFNEELGRMNLWVWPIIVVPSMIVMVLVFLRLMNGLTAITGLSSDEIFHAEKARKEKEKAEELKG